MPMRTLESVDRPTRVRFDSGPLTLGGELWCPRGRGPFPAVVWNHGSVGRERGLQAPRRGDDPTTVETWLSLGLAVFAPGRRGYDGAPGATLAEALQGEPEGSEARDELLVERLRAESDDVLAAVTYLESQTWVDRHRIVCAGYSLGAILTLLVLARSDHFVAGVTFALGAILWGKSKTVREFLIRTAGKVDTPVMIIQSENDYSTAPTPAIAAVLRQRGVDHLAIVYPPLGEGPRDGHVFCALGGRAWGPDARDFLERVGTPG